MVDADRLDARRARPLHSAGVLAIRDDHRDARVEPPRGNGVDQRLQVAAAPRDEHPETAVNGVGSHFSRTVVDSRKRYPDCPGRQDAKTTARLDSGTVLSRTQSSGQARALVRVR
jgi:hypothetical protein